MDMPADGILIESNEISTDESAMTGETDPINKNVFKHCLRKKQHLEQSGEKNLADKHEVPSPIVMSGTKILTGEGRMMVMVVGKESCIGKVKALLEKEEAEPTPLQQKLEKLADDIGRFGLYAAIVIVAVLLIRFTIFKIITKEWDTAEDLLKILDYFILGVLVVVLAIPEGLPLAVTLSLAFSVKKMLRDQNLVRKMEACETMGGANNICSDKTGTLTMNKMELSQVWNREVKVISTHSETHTEADLGTDPQYLEMFKIGALVNSTALLEPEEKGSSTEIALLKFFKKMGVSYDEYREKYEPKLKFPFSSSRKRMSVVVEYKGDAYLFIKGASEIVLKSSDSWYNTGSGEVEPISHQVNQELNTVITKMAQNSLRTLCIGYKKLAAHDDLEKKNDKGVFDCEQSNITLISVIGVRDNPRKEVPGAIQKCHKAGITVRMVTGDNIITAKAIAKDIGILTEDSDAIAMEGPDFVKLVGGIVCKKCRTNRCDCPTDSKKAKEEGTEMRIDTIANGDEFDKIKDKLLVLARSRPEDKYCLVTGLRERGDVVAVTGDGTNDAPALKKADVGFAMGIAGTEVAREAAAIILVDDNFNSIVAAVLWGRNIFDSIRKFVQFQLTVNVVAVTLTLLGAAIIESDILKPIQLLWINLIMDTLASLALATEEPTDELLDRKPHSRDEYIISKTMLKHIIGQSIFQLVVILFLVFAGEYWIPEYSDSYDTGVFKNDPGMKWHNGVVGGTVRSGRFYHPSGSDDYFPIFEEHRIYSRHLTFVFNTFVMMQIFDFFNARKLHEEVLIPSLSSTSSPASSTTPSSPWWWAPSSSSRSSSSPSPARPSASTATSVSPSSSGSSPYFFLHVDRYRFWLSDCVLPAEAAAVWQARPRPRGEWGYWQQEDAPAQAVCVITEAHRGTRVA